MAYMPKTYTPTDEELLDPVFLDHTPVPDGIAKELGYSGSLSVGTLFKDREDTQRGLFTDAEREAKRQKISEYVARQAQQNALGVRSQDFASADDSFIDVAESVKQQFPYDLPQSEFDLGAMQQVHNSAFNRFKKTAESWSALESGDPVALGKVDPEAIQGWKQIQADKSREFATANKQRWMPAALAVTAGQDVVDAGRMFGQAASQFANQFRPDYLTQEEKEEQYSRRSEHDRANDEYDRRVRLAKEQGLPTPKYDVKPYISPFTGDSISAKRAAEREAAQKLERDVDAEQSAMLAESRKDDPWYRRMALGTASVAPGMIIGAGLSAVTPAAGLAYWGMREGIPAQQTVKAQGGSLEAQALTGLGVGIVNSILERFQLSKLKWTAAGKETADSMKKSLTSFVLKKFGGAAVAMGEEVGAEALQEITPLLSQWATAVAEKNGWEEKDWKAAWEDIVNTTKEAAISMPFLTLPGHALHAASGASNIAKYQRRFKEEIGTDDGINAFLTLNPQEAQSLADMDGKKIPSRKEFEKLGMPGHWNETERKELAASLNAELSRRAVSLAAQDAAITEHVGALDAEAQQSAQAAQQEEYAAVDRGSREAEAAEQRRRQEAEVAQEKAAYESGQSRPIELRPQRTEPLPPTASDLKVSSLTDYAGGELDYQSVFNFSVADPAMAKKFLGAGVSDKTFAKDIMGITDPMPKEEFKGLRHDFGRKLKTVVAAMEYERQLKRPATKNELLAHLKEKGMTLKKEDAGEILRAVHQEYQEEVKAETESAKELYESQVERMKFPKARKKLLGTSTTLVDYAAKPGTPLPPKGGTKAAVEARGQAKERARETAPPVEPEAPVPTQSTRITSNRMAKKAEIEIDRQLVQFAVEKSKTNGDEYNNFRYSKMDANRLTPAERNDLNTYLYGTMEGVRPLPPTEPPPKPKSVAKKQPPAAAPVAAQTPPLTTAAKQVPPAAEPSANAQKVKDWLISEKGQAFLFKAAGEDAAQDAWIQLNKKAESFVQPKDKTFEQAVMDWAGPSVANKNKDAIKKEKRTAAREKEAGETRKGYAERKQEAERKLKQRELDLLGTTGGNFLTPFTPARGDDAPATPIKRAPVIQKRIDKSYGTKLAERWKEVKDFVKAAGVLFRPSTAMHIPRLEKFTTIIEHFHNYQFIRETEHEKVLRTVGRITSPIAGQNDYQLFEEYLRIKNIEESMNRNEGLPFGYDRPTVRSEVEQLQKMVDENEHVKKALAARKELKDIFTDELEEHGLLPKYDNLDEEQSKKIRQFYWHQQVLSYAKVTALAGGSPSKTVRSAQKSRVQVSESGEREKGKWTTEQRPEEYDYNSNYLETEVKWMTDMAIELAHQKWLQKLDMLAGEKTRLEEGYVEWRPNPGHPTFKRPTIEIRLAEALAEEIMDDVDVPDETKQALNAELGQNKLYILPVEVAKQLNSMDRREESGLDEFAAKIRILVGWAKQYMLFTPKTFVKYFIRNLTGDVEVGFTLGIAAAKNIPRAIKTAHRYYRGDPELDAETADALKFGVFSSAFVTQEMADVRSSTFLERLTKNDPRLPKVRRGIPVVSSYFETVRKWDQHREATERLAAYFGALDEIKQHGHVVNFGGANPHRVMRIQKELGNAAAAAYVSRKTIGDYSDMTVFGEWVRRYIYPFWGFQEVNLKRWPTMMRNAFRKAEKTVVIDNGVVDIEVYIKNSIRGILLARMTLATAASTIFNHLVAPYLRPDDDELPPSATTKVNVRLGKTNTGKSAVFTNVGTLQDFGAWFGIPQLVASYHDFSTGKMSAARWLGEAGMAIINDKFFDGLAPWVKVIPEVASGRTIFPDIRTPLPNDRLNILAQTVGLSDEFMAFKGKFLKTGERARPDRFERMFYNVFDTRETALQYAYEWKDMFLTSKDKEPFRGNQSPTRIMRMAANYNDFEAFKEARKIYLKNNGWDNFEGSVDRFGPLSGLNQDLRVEFETQYLNEAERRQLQVAIDHAENIKEKMYDFWDRAENEE
mgnify:FL=1